MSVIFTCERLESCVTSVRGLTQKHTRRETAQSQQTATMMSISRLSFYGIAITTLLCGFITSTVVAFMPSNNNAAVANSRTSSSSLQMTLLTGNGKKVDVPAGSPLKNAVAKLGIKPKYSCKK